MKSLRTGLSCFVVMALLALTNPCVAAAPKLSGYDSKADPEIALSRALVEAKAYIGDENQNTSFFSRLPKASGYPHFWVISSDGQTKRSVNTAPLGNGGKSYDKSGFLKFIRDMER